jgi:hypothetical protein
MEILDHTPLGNQSRKTTAMAIYNGEVWEWIIWYVSNITVTFADHSLGVLTRVAGNSPYIQVVYLTDSFRFKKFLTFILNLHI